MGGAARKQNRSLMMADMPMGKLIARMSIPLMLSMLIQALYNIVDSIFVARLGQEAISAVGIAFPIQMLAIAVASGLSAGMNAQISQRFGRGERDRAGGAAGNAVMMTGIISLAFLLFGIFGCAPYLRACNDNAQIVQYGVEYLEVVCIGGFGIFYLILTERFLQVTGRTGLSMLAQLFGAVTNIVLDPILIFGYFGLPAMGVRGAAWATVIGQVLAMAFGLLLHRLVNHELTIKRKDLRLTRDSILILRVGLPVTMTLAMGSVMVFCLNRLLAPYVEALAVFSIYFKLQSFFFMPIAGMMQGLGPIIGYNYGAQQGRRLRQAMRIGMTSAFCIATAGFLLCQICPDAIFNLFDDGSGNTSMLSLGSRVVRIISFTFPIAGVAMVFSNVFQGMGTGVPGMVFGLLRQCLVIVPAAALLLHFIGIDAVWYAFWISEGITAIVTAFVCTREYKRRVSPFLAAPSNALADS